MSRYIDADALKMDLYSIAKADCGYTADVLAGLMIAERAIDNAPTVDAVEVVRCRDCQWYGGHERACPLAASGLSANRIKLPKEDDFCSYVERRKEKG